MVITNIFCLKEENILIVHLGSYDWDCKKFGPVTLRFSDNNTIKCHYYAYGDTAGNLALRLKLNDPLFKRVEDIEQLFFEFDGDVYIDRE